MKIKIAEAISDLIARDIPFTDINVRPGMPIYYRSPVGYQAIEGDITSKEDIELFCELADGRWKERIEKNGGQFDTGLTLKGIARLRCNFLHFGSGNSVGAVIWKLPIEAPKLDKIGVSLELKRLINMQPKGLVLISGPTGSGKSTTLAAIIDHLNETRPLSIITIEQPIEYEFIQKRSIITQREVPTNVTSFQAGIESSKRQDPDIIMVGEVRDRGTVDAMLTAACSGHLVFATTHARSAQESCESLLSYYADEELRQKRNLLASSLLAVNSQVLLPSADRKSFVLGYELMVVNQQISMMLNEGKVREIGAAIQNPSIGQTGLISLNECLMRLVENKIISREDAQAAAYNKEEIGRRLMANMQATGR